MEGGKTWGKIATMMLATPCETIVLMAMTVAAMTVPMAALPFLSSPHSSRSLVILPKTDRPTYCIATASASARATKILRMER